MEQPIAIAPLTVVYQAEIEAWANAGSALFKTSIMGTANGQETKGWVALIDQQPVGAVTVQQQTNGVSYLYVIVKPSERRKGIGASLVTTAINDAQTKSQSKLHALVEPENTAAQKILTKRGFSQVGYGPDGEIEFELH